MTELLGRLRGGDEAASDVLLDLVYGELHGLAAAIFAGQSPGHTLQPTALVNEAWMKLANHLVTIDDRRHFFVIAAKAMRQVLADHARGRGRLKRGGASGRRVNLDSAVMPLAPVDVDLVALDDSLVRLADLNERHARVVELRLLGSLTIDETADVLGISHSTVEADWAMARAWLRRELASS